MSDEPANETGAVRRGKPLKKLRWPKGPFPEKYRWETVERRIAGAWDDPRRSAAEAIVVARGWRAHAEQSDGYVKHFVRDDGAPLELDALRDALASSSVFAFRCELREPSEGTPEIVLGLVGSTDPMDAVVAVGVAGPRQGVGVTTLVRFLFALRQFATISIDVLGEERLGMTIAPHDPDKALRIAERVLQLCPAVGRGGTTAPRLALEMETAGRLDLSWS